MERKNAMRLISTRRAELKLTYEDVAKSVGVTKSTVFKWEKGKAIPSAVRAVKLAETLELPSTALLEAYLRKETK